MLRLQSSSPVCVIIFLIINFIILSSSAPISEEFQEIDLPTDEITENDLSRLSDSELLELERALQNKIEEFENEKNGFVEDSIPIRLNNNNNNFDNRRYLQAMEMRERRAGGRSSPIGSGSGSANMVPVLNEDGGVELFPIMEDEQQPIVVIEEPVTEEEMLQQQINGGGDDGDDRQFVLIPEGDDEIAEAEAEGLIPIEMFQDEIQSQQQQQPQELLLSENDIDELELRQRLAQLGEQLTKRSIQGF